MIIISCSFHLLLDINECTTQTHDCSLIFNPYFDLSIIARMQTENIYMKTSLLWVCFLLNYFLKKGSLRSWRYCIVVE